MRQPSLLLNSNTHSVKAPVLLLTLLTLVSLVSNTGNAQNQKIAADKTKSFMSYTMVHPMHEWTGTSQEVNSIILYNPQSDGIESAAVSIRLSSFDSKNSNRDSHALEVLDAIKFPNVKFASTAIKQQGNELTIEGRLIFHNVTRDVTIHALRQISKKEIIITGTFPVNITDYNIDPPSLVGIKTKEEITMVFKLVFPVSVY